MLSQKMPDAGLGQVSRAESALIQSDFSWMWEELPPPAEEIVRLIHTVSGADRVKLEPAITSADAVDGVWYPVPGGQSILRLCGLPGPLPETVAAQVLPLVHILGTQLAEYSHWEQERRASADEHIQTQKMLDALLETSTDAIYVKNRAGIYLMANAGCSGQAGIPCELIPGKTDEDIFGDDAEQVREWDEKVLTAGEPISYERSTFTMDGAERVYLTHKEPLRDGNGDIVGLVGISRDITERKRMELAFEENALRYETLFLSYPTPLWLYDPRTLKFVAVNAAAQEQYGYTQEEFLNMTVGEIRPAHLLGAFVKTIQARRVQDRYGPMVWTHRRKDGSIFDAEVISGPYHFRGEDLRLVQSVDVSERERARRERKELAARLAGAFDGASIGMAIIALDGSVLQVNPALNDLTLYSTDELERMPFVELVHEEQREDFGRHLATLGSGELDRYQETLRVVRGDGQERYALVTVSVIWDAGVPRFLMGQVQDVNEQWEVGQRLRWQAYHDALTGLANRSAFEEELRSVIQRASEPDAPEIAAAILLMDLDRFKRINDSLGHAAGDQLIQVMAKRLEKASPPDAVIARMGGDEFTVLLRYEGPNAVSVVEQRARETARWLLDTMIHPEGIGGQEVFVSGSIGISLFPNDGTDAEALLKNADVALYRAKENGRGKFEFYIPTMNAAAALRLRLETDLRRALERKEISLCYQPQIEVLSGRIIGVEALSRWQHSEWGILLPGQFLSLIEESGLSLTFDYWVLGETCRQARRWHDAGFDCAMAVNLSARFFAEPDVVNYVAELLTTTGCPPHLLELEMTETTMMESGPTARERLWGLKNLGVRLSVDDFGTGYSTLSYLRYFPLDVLKIDRSFVENLPEDVASRAVVRTLVDLARDLGLFLIAEGVERTEQRNALVDMGCDAIQGFLISPAVSAPELEKLLISNRGSHPNP